MLSSFLKKLLFARQFFIMDGKIEVLGERQVMLPARMLMRIHALRPKESSEIIKQEFRAEVERYARKIGSGEEGMLKNLSDVFETIGIGKMEIVDLDNEKKRAIVRIENPLAENEQAVIAAFLAGTFSFIFRKEVNAQPPSERKKADEFIVR